MLFELGRVAVLCLFHKRHNSVRYWKNIILDLKGNLFRLNGEKSTFTYRANEISMLLSFN
jgi:hypothetical protein